MSLYDKIKKVYPELTNNDFLIEDGVINLFCDGDGVEYIARWDYYQPIPEGLKLGK